MDRLILHDIVFYKCLHVARARQHFVNYIKFPPLKQNIQFPKKLFELSCWRKQYLLIEWIVNRNNEFGIGEKAADKRRNEHKNDRLCESKTTPVRFFVDVYLCSCHCCQLLFRQLRLFLQLLVDSAHPVDGATMERKLAIL